MLEGCCVQERRNQTVQTRQINMMSVCYFTKGDIVGTQKIYYFIIFIRVTIEFKYSSGSQFSNASDTTTLPRMHLMQPGWTVNMAGI